MYPKKITECEFSTVDVFGVDMLFTEERILREDSILEGLYLYDTRHGDDGDWCAPITIENHVLVNYCGCLVSNIPIDIPKYGVTLKDEDFGYTDDEVPDNPIEYMAVANKKLVESNIRIDSEFIIDYRK